jgi:hypothetical protein
MLKRNLGLVALSAFILVGAVAFAAIPADNAPDPDKQDSQRMSRKNGDMVIFYHGRRGYVGRSLRRGSIGTRSYRGGGLRGGK